MSKSNDHETDYLLLIYNNTAIANIGDASGIQPSAAAGSLFVSLHTADPGETGNQSTNEATYTSYAREAVVRSGAGWTITGNNASNTALITFAQATGGSETITFFGIGYELAGGTKLIGSGALTASLAVSNGITPEFAIGAADHFED